MPNYVKTVNLPLRSLLQAISSGDTDGAMTIKNSWKNALQPYHNFVGTILSDDIVITDDIATTLGDIYFEYSIPDERFKVKIQISLYPVSTYNKVKVCTYICPAYGNEFMSSVTAEFVVRQNAAFQWNNVPEYFVVEIVNMAIGGQDIKVSVSGSSPARRPWFTMDWHIGKIHYIYPYYINGVANNTSGSICYYADEYPEICTPLATTGNVAYEYQSDNYFAAFPLPVKTLPKQYSDSIYVICKAPSYALNGSAPLVFYSDGEKSYAHTWLCYIGISGNATYGHSYEVAEWPN